MWQRLKSSKTVKLALAGILTAGGTYLAGEIELKELIFVVVNGLGLIFLRDGIAKGG